VDKLSGDEALKLLLGLRSPIIIDFFQKFEMIDGRQMVTIDGLSQKS
jgi:hypothetical protein